MHAALDIVPGWFQMDGLAFGICIRWHVYQTQVAWHAEQSPTLVVHQVKTCIQPCRVCLLLPSNDTQ